MQLLTRILLGLLLALAANSNVSAGVVTVWGEEVNPALGAKILINNFYNSLPGTSSLIANGDLTTVDLTTTNLLWATQPADDYTPAELARRASFVASGGRIAFMGAHGHIAPNQNLRIHAALAYLGSSITINNLGFGISKPQPIGTAFSAPASKPKSPEGDPQPVSWGSIRKSLAFASSRSVCITPFDPVSWHPGMAPTSIRFLFLTYRVISPKSWWFRHPMIPWSGCIS